VFFDKLQSGFLVFETPQGFTRIELSPRQRVTLLWTFRNFRQLSIPLLNPRERELVTSLFRNNAPIVFDYQDPSFVIGVVENFVPLTPLTGTMLTHKSVAAQKVDQEIITAEPEAIVASPLSARALTPVAPELAPVSAETTELAVAEITPVRLTPAKRKTKRLAPSRLATSLAALCLCVGSVAAWHRIQGPPVSHGFTRPQLQRSKTVAAPDSPDAAQTETHSENRIAPSVSAVAPTAVASPAVASPRIAEPKGAFRQAAITAVVPKPAPTPLANQVSLSKGAVSGRVPASTTKLPLSSEDRSIQASRPPLHFVYPEYSDVHARGVVSLKAELDSAGSVRSVKLVSGNRALAAAALRAVRKWRYRPYLKDGEPVATETYIVISFISEDAVSMSFPPSISATR
jgi:TonB family protein